MEDGSGVRTRTWTVRRPPLSPPAGVAPLCEVPVRFARRPLANLGGAPVVLAGGPSPPVPPRLAVRPAVRWGRAPSAAVLAAAQAQTFADTSGQTENGHVCHASAHCGGQLAPIHAI